MPKAVSGEGTFADVVAAKNDEEAYDLLVIGGEEF